MREVHLDSKSVKKLLEILDVEAEFAEEYQLSKKARDDLQKLNDLRQALHWADTHQMLLCFHNGVIDQALIAFPIDVAMDLSAELKKEISFLHPDSDAAKERQDLDREVRTAICRTLLGKRFWRLRKKLRERPDLHLEG